MKHLKKFLAIATVLVVFMAPFLSSPMTAHAEEATTYYIKYVPSVNEFRYQKGPWQDGQEHWGISSIETYIKDGDHLAIDCTDGRGIIFSVDVNLGMLTLINGNSTVVTAKSIDTVYALHGTTSAINGNVNTANLYGDSTANFNNNVKVLNLGFSGTTKPQGDVFVLGTCDELHIENSSNAYSFQECTLYVLGGSIATDSKYFSPNPPTTTTPPSTSNSEYDDVPKTADSRFNPLWLVGLAAICFAGSIGLKKSK